MKIKDLTQTLTPFVQFKKAECCTPVPSISLTGPDHDTVSFGMGPAEGANPFKKRLEVIKPSNVAKIVPDNVETGSISKLADLQRAAFTSPTAGF